MTRIRTQRATLSAPATFTGVGLFSARACDLTIGPAGAGTGIVFTHHDHAFPAHIDRLSSRPAHPAFAQMKPRCTSLGDEHATIATIATIEHLMSALAGLGVTDARIEIGSVGPHAEIPIMDGSALGFVRMIRGVGLTNLDQPIDPVRVRQPIVVASGDASITIEPAEHLHYQYTLDYSDGPLQRTTVRWEGDQEDYARNIAPARTFCMAHEAAAMRQLGLFTHLSARDMLVIGDAGPIENQYRMADECAKHKLLDLIGDLALVGGPLIAGVFAVRSGHALAHEAARAILAQSR